MRVVPMKALAFLALMLLPLASAATIAIDRAQDNPPLFDKYAFSFDADPADFNADDLNLSQPAHQNQCTPVVLRVDSNETVLDKKHIRISLGKQGLVVGDFNVGELQPAQALTGSQQDNKFIVDENYLLKVYCNENTYENEFQVAKPRTLADAAQAAADWTAVNSTFIQLILIVGTLILALLFLFKRSA